jgi:hypothetical protein
MKRILLGCIAALAMLLPILSKAQMPDTNKISLSAGVPTSLNTKEKYC